MDTHEAQREELRGLQNIFENAVKNNSIEDMREHVSGDFSFVSFTDTAFADFDAFVKQWGITRSDMVGDGKFSTQLNPAPTIFIDDVAIATGNAQNNMVDKKGDTYDFTTNWTVVFQKENDNWKVVRAHNSLNPFSSPMLKNGVKRLIMKASFAAFVLGGITGWLLGCLL